MMSTPVMFVLSALLVTMVTGSGYDVPALPHIDLLGEWFIMGTATNGWNINNGWSDRRNYTVVDVSNWPPQDAHWPRGGLEFTFRWPLFPPNPFIQPLCINRTIDWLRMYPGLFMYHDNRDGVLKGYFEMSVLDELLDLLSDPFTTKYVVLQTTALSLGQGSDQFILDLYSSRPVVTLSPIAKDFFLDIAQKHGIPPANVTFLANDRFCSMNGPR